MSCRAGGVLALTAPNTLSIHQSSFIRNTADQFGGAIALLGGMGENHVILEGAVFQMNVAEMGEDVSISSPTTVFTDLGDGEVAVEASPGYAWNPAAPSAAPMGKDTVGKPLLTGEEAWITSTDMVR